jgi:hypothetical protein
VIKTALLVDADLICYRSAAVCEARSVEIKHIKSGKVKEFKTRTEFKKFLQQKDFVYRESDYEFTDLQNPQPAAHAFHTIKSQLQNFKTKFKPDIFHVVLSGKGNFREELPLPKKYKGNRADSIRPLLLEQCKKYIREKYEADVVAGCEADDAIIYYGYEYKKLGYDVVIASIDKDAKAYSGLNVWDFTDIESQLEMMPALGYLKQTRQGIKGAGFLWYCFQMLKGDDTDFYRPFESFGIKYGEKSVYEYLKDSASEQDALARVIGQYKKFIPDKFDYTDWSGKEHSGVDYTYWLALYHKCVRMKETRTDALDFSEFCKKNGVAL